MEESECQRVRFAGCSYDARSAQIINTEGQSIGLRPQSVNVFRYLSSRPDELVSRDDLLEQVWPNVHVTDDSLTKCVSEIRKALGAGAHNVLRTVPKRGYILVADRATNTEDVSSSGSFTGTPQGTSTDALSREGFYFWGKNSVGAPGRRFKSRFPVWAMATSVLVALVLLVATGNKQKETGVGNPAIAVMPFSTATPQPRWQRLANALGSDLLAELARNEWLRVYQLKDDAELQELLKTGVQIRFVLDGTLHGEAENLRVTAKLTDALSREVIWSGHWQKPVSSIFSIQDDIIGRTGASMGSAWSGVMARHALAQARRRPTESLTAYELYLLGNEHKHKFNEDDYKLAVNYLEQAVAIDKEFGKAWASLAIVHALRTDPTNTEAGRNAILQDRLRATRYAIDADPADPDVLIQLSWLEHFQGNPDASESALRAAVDAAPNNADLLAQAAWAGPERADVANDAVQWAQRAIELNPGHPTWYLTGLLTAAFHAGKYQLVLDVASRAPETLGRLTYEAAAAVHLDHTQRVQEVVGKILDLNPGFSIDTYHQTDPIMNDRVRQQFQSGLSKAGLPRNTPTKSRKIKISG